MRRILVTGDRNWNCFVVAVAVLKQLVAESAPDPIVIVHGNCRGVDRSFKAACKFMGILDEPHEAAWNKYPRNSAGPIRNSEMVKLGASVCLAFHRDLVNSNGTKDCAGKALAAGIPVMHCDGTEPLSLWQIVEMKDGEEIVYSSFKAVPA